MCRVANTCDEGVADPSISWELGAASCELGALGSDIALTRPGVSRYEMHVGRGWLIYLFSESSDLWASGAVSSQEHRNSPHQLRLALKVGSDIARPGTKYLASRSEIIKGGGDYMYSARPAQDFYEIPVIR